MRKTVISVVIAAMAFATSCNDAPKGDASTTGAAAEVAAGTGDTYNVDVASSKLTWQGSGVGHGHQGTFPISAGTLNVADGKVNGGSFTIDVKGMAASDVQGEEATKLIGHLLSDDFFKSAKFPTAKFDITSVAPSQDSNANAILSGNLTLLDSTVNVTFPATITSSDSGLTAKANFTIDRRKWGMVYGNDKSLGDKFISENVVIGVELAAKK